MNRATSLLVTLLGVVVATAGLTAPAVAETLDTAGPQLLDVDRVLTAPVAPGESVSLQVRASEPVHVVVSYRSPSGQVRSPQGDIEPGVRESFSFVVGAEDEVGGWVLDSVRLVDAALNETTYWRDGRMTRTPETVTGLSSHVLDFYEADYSVMGAPRQPPQNVVAKAGHLGALVTWSAPAGSDPVSSYRVTAVPGDRTITLGGTSRAARFSGLPEGPYTFTVTPINRVGEGPASQPSNEVVAYIDELAPTVTITSPAWSYSRNLDEVTFQVEEDGLVDRVECSLDGATFAACSSPWRISRPGDGPHEVRVRAIDTAGNGSMATRAFTEDHTLPVVKLGARPADPTSSRTADFTYTLTDAVSGVRSVECYLDGGRRSEGCTETGIGFTGLTEGSHTLMLVVKDIAWNTYHFYYDWRIDGTAPAVTVTAAPSTRTTDRSATIAFSVSEQGSVTLQCQLDDQPAQGCYTRSVTYPELSLGRHTVTITARDQAGNTTTRMVVWSVVAVPDAPTEVTAEPRDQEAVVSWRPSAEHETPVTGYVVTASPGGRSVTVPADRTTAGLSGLTNGTAYTFSVVAQSAVGTSAPSEASAEVVPAGPPGVPREVTAARGDRAATVSWQPAGGNGAPVTGYTVTVAPLGRTFAAPGDRRSVVVDDLVGVGPYTFTVRATTWVGDSPASAPTWVVLADAPEAPAIVSAVPGSRSVTLTWTRPESHGLAISDYTITASPGGHTWTVGTERTSFTFSGLTNGTAYTFTVRATSPAGSSAASVSSSPVVAAGPPGRVRRPDLTRASRGRVVVRWSAPSDNASPIKRYRVVSSSGRAKVVGADVRRTVFKAGRGRHEFTVAAVNAIGLGHPSRPAVIRIVARR